MVVPVLVRAGTYTCEAVVVAGIVAKVGAADGATGAAVKPNEGARVIVLELVGLLTRLVITWTCVVIGFKLDVATGVILTKLLLETEEGFLLN